MSKRLFILIPALFGLLSCVSEQEETGYCPDPEFTAALERTRTTVCTDEDSMYAGKISWESDDVILLTGSSGIPIKYGIKTIHDDGTALFVKESGEPSVGDGPYSAVYGTESLKNQSYSGKAADVPMAAYSDNGFLHFTTTCGLLKIHLENEGTSISRIIARSETDSLYTLTCNPSVDISKGADFFLALPEGAYDEFTFVNKDGKACTKLAKEGRETIIRTNHIKSTSFVSSLSFVYSLGCIEAEVQADGSVKAESCSICLNCKVGGNTWSVVPSETESGTPSRNFIVKGTDGLTYFSGTFEWAQQGSGTIKGKVRINCERDMDAVELCPKLCVPYATYPSSGWTSREYSFTYGQSGFYKSFTENSFVFRMSPSDIISFNFDSPVKTSIVKGSEKTGLWYIKFGLGELGTDFKAGDSSSFSFNVSSARDIRLSQYESYIIGQSDTWTEFEILKDILPGSALDFSSLGFQDAPAGKYGWLKATDGAFEFEGKPGVPQKFCGVNLCQGANFISHEMADDLAARLAALGYNAVRIHHHDKDILTGNNWDNLDYLLARLFEKGIYATTDLYVSRNVKYSTLGLEGSGNMTKGLYKNLVGCYEPAFNDWCKFAKKFLEHVNPYTGRAYRDEPGIPLVCVINEGKLSNCGEKECPPIQQAWHDYGGQGTLSWNTPGFDEFEEYLGAQVFTRCSSYLKSLGIKALLTNDNSGKRHGDMEGNTKLYDYVDNHFYIDYPDAIDGDNAVPSTISNVNLACEGGPEMFRREYVRTARKPYTVTEWNYCGPNRYRGMSGMMIGSMAGIGGWDGIWRFAYSHSAEDIGHNPDSYPSRVNLASDPLNLASERATVCLYLRDDISSNGSISFDKPAGIMKVVSDRTCGFFVKNGKLSAGPLEAKVSNAPASIWVSSLDSKSISMSDRILLIHATDIQGKDVKYGDRSRTMLLAWGRGTVIQNGSAEISLSLDNVSGWKIHELASDGRRIREIPYSADNEKLTFSVSTDGPSGGRMYYELIRI